MKKNIIFFAQSKQMANNTKLLYDDEEEAKADDGVQDAEIVEE